MKTLFVISGYMRSGTSMMMKALIEGGMDAVYREEREEMRKRFTDERYDPNRDGLFELSRQDYQEYQFPRKFEGKLIKGLRYCVPKMSPMPNGIRVVLMRRDVEEIRQSFNAFFNRQIPPEEMVMVDKEMEDVAECILNRKDILSLDVFWYRELLADPRKHFQILKDHGWEFDLEKAVASIDPSRIRYKREELSEGVL